MAIEVGDGVLKFLGDSTQLDTAFDSVGPKAEAAFEPAAKSAEDLGDKLDDVGKKADGAADEIEDAGNRTRSSMHAATGEVALLGEGLVFVCRVTFVHSLQSCRVLVRLLRPHSQQLLFCSWSKL